MANMRPTPSQGAMAAARSASGHGKLHKRGVSASAIQTSPTISLDPLPTYNGDYRSPLAHHELPPSPTSASIAKTKIKPLLRKLTTGESNSLDLSRSAAENEGLGIYTEDFGASRAAADVTFASTGKRGAAHNRSTSGTSQFSTATSGSNHRAPYVHPMRQTPRPYTPPIAQSYAPSYIGSEHSGENSTVTTNEEYQFGAMARDQSHSSRNTTAPLRIQTNTSSTRLVYGSQTNLAGTPLSNRMRTDAESLADTVSPISRSSLDKTPRIRSTSNLDPTTRAASIAAARQAFSEKELAKAKKAEKEELRQADRQRKREEGGRRKSETKVRSRSNTLNEKIEPLEGREYSNLTPVPTQSRPLPVVEVGEPPRPTRTNTNLTAKSVAKSRWIGFLTWLKTKIFNLGRKVATTT
ncbi:MAG: hypothetical protein M1827_006155 [Pycnora praestabilis]|nr:MAG: hypothetical protein M1827_006155 [Pycnora praestabilis]